MSRRVSQHSSPARVCPLPESYKESVVTAVNVASGADVYTSKRLPAECPAQAEHHNPKEIAHEFHPNSSVGQREHRSARRQRHWRVSVVVGVVRPVSGALLEERVAAFGGFVSAIRQPGRLARKQLLPDEAVVDQVECIFEHPLRSG